MIAGVPPAGAFKWSPDLRPAPTIIALNARLRALARREGAIFVDYATVIGQPDGAMRPELSLDGVHPNAAAYARMAPLARTAVATASR